MNILRTSDQSESNRIGGSPRRLREVSGVGAPPSDPEGNDVVPQRRSHSSRNKGEEQPGKLPTEAPLSHFVNGTCKICKHPKTIHFIDTDEIGTWSFCSVSICDCFVDERNENDVTPTGDV